MRHEIVVWPSFLDGITTVCKVGRLDFGFQLGDEVVFRVWWDGGFTGEEKRRRIVDLERSSLMPEWVTMTLAVALPASSREIAELVCGPIAAENFVRVKSLYTKLGKALERTFAEAVGGSRRDSGGPDVVTRLGVWAFATQANTKNSHGTKADLASVPAGYAVQVFGTPNPGWISVLEFLALHGIEDPPTVADRCVLEATRIARDGGEQMCLAAE